MATTTTFSPALDETSVQQLAAAMRGELVRPGDPGYNAMIDRRPALIARCANVADVIAAVAFAAAATAAPASAPATTGW